MEVELHYPNGEVKARFTVTEYGIDSWYEEWSKYGSLIHRAHYQHGKLHGLYEKYYSDETLKYRYTYVDGKKEGPFTAWHRNGQLWQEYNFVEDKMEGIGRVYDEDGYLSQTYFNRNDKISYITYHNRDESSYTIQPQAQFPLFPDE